SMRACATGSRWRHSTKAACRNLAALCRCGSEPRSGKTGSLQSTPDRRHTAHVSPDKIVAIVRRLKQDWALVDREIVLGNPAVLRIDHTALALGVHVGKTRVEAVDKAVLPENARAVLVDQRLSSGNDQLRC